MLPKASALTKNDPFVLGQSDPHEEQRLQRDFAMGAESSLSVAPKASDPEVPLFSSRVTS